MSFKIVKIKKVREIYLKKKKSFLTILVKKYILILFFPLLLMLSLYIAIGETGFLIIYLMAGF